jgi:3-hydroxyisobutyrate dehydrogenase-like beta-hydroxyacid dehydrogenase
MKVGFIGLGRMGMPMSRNLLQAGFYLTVHNRSRPKVDDLVRHGAHLASNPREVTQASDLVLACLPNVPTIEEVFLGENGVIEASSPGQVLVDLSTVGPQTSRRIAREAQAKGAAFLDAPVSGGVERAAQASLTIIAGGDEDAFQKALPILQALGDTIRHVGPSGSGSVVKLVNQLLVGVHTLAASEALVLGAKAGADPRLLLEILSSSWGASFMLSRNGPVILDGTYDDARGPLRLLLKDSSLVADMAREAGVPLYAGSQALKMFQRAADMGLAKLDLSAMALVLEQEAGVRVSEET